MAQRKSLPPRREWTSQELQAINAVRVCCERWGVEKTTIGDIANQSGLSRATLYRLFPGGRDVLFEAHRVAELDEFFSALVGEIGEPVDLHDLIARTVSTALRELRNDAHLAIMLASEPGEMITELTVGGLPRIIHVATAYMSRLVEPYIGRDDARRLIDLIARLVISYFLAPSSYVDLTDYDQAYEFVAPFIPAPQTTSPQTTSPQTINSETP